MTVANTKFGMELRPEDTTNKAFKKSNEMKWVTTNVTKLVFEKKPSQVSISDQDEGNVTRFQWFFLIVKALIVWVRLMGELKQLTEGS